MIRIDLGKDDFEKGPKKTSLGQSLLNDLQRLLPKKMNIPGGGNPNVDTNLVIIVGIALFVGYLPNHIVGNLKDSYRQKYTAQAANIQKGIQELDSQIGRFSQFKNELDSYEEQKKLVT